MARDRSSVTRRLVYLWSNRKDADRLDPLEYDPVFAKVEEWLRVRRQQRCDSPVPPRTNFYAAFKDGQRFISDRGRVITARAREVARLVVTSGRILIGDPFYGPLKTPLVRTVPPGTYPVLLSAADGRIASAMLVIKKQKPIRWEMAVWPGQDVNTLQGDSFYGYGVDAGTGCFLDADQDQYLNSLGDEALFDYDAKKTAEDPFIGEWVDKVFSKVTGGNIVAFSSGWGDGCYASYWGLDGDGEVTCLATDFQVLLDFPSIRIPFQGLFLRPPGEVRHRALESLDLLMEVIPGTKEGRSIVLGLFGPNASQIGFRLLDNSGNLLSSEQSKINVRGDGTRNIKYSLHEIVLHRNVKEPGEVTLELSVMLDVAPMQTLES